MPFDLAPKPSQGLTINMPSHGHFFSSKRSIRSYPFAKSQDNITNLPRNCQHYYGSLPNKHRLSVLSKSSLAFLIIPEQTPRVIKLDEATTVDNSQRRDMSSEPLKNVTENAPLSFVVPSTPSALVKTTPTHYTPASDCLLPSPSNDPPRSNIIPPAVSMAYSTPPSTLPPSPTSALTLAPQSSKFEPPAPWVILACTVALTMLLANAHRNIASMLLPLEAAPRGWGAAEIGTLQAAVLFGYLAGQVPAGRLSDSFGGENVLLTGLFLWSLAIAATLLSPPPFLSSAIMRLSTFLAGHGIFSSLGSSSVNASQLASFSLSLLSRTLFGFLSATIMPATSSVAARFFPPSHRATALASVYACFNLGGVFGNMGAAPLLHAAGGNASTAFILSGLGGAIWAVAGGFILQDLFRSRGLETVKTRNVLRDGDGDGVGRSGERTRDLEAKDEHCSSGCCCEASDNSNNYSHCRKKELDVRDGGHFLGKGISNATNPSTTLKNNNNEIPPNHQPPATSHIPAPLSQSETWIQVLALCWAHAAIGWGFFTLQSWVPVYFRSLGINDLSLIGRLSGAPSLAAALAGSGVAYVADHLMNLGSCSRLDVRRIMHGATTLGCALGMAPLALFATTHLSSTARATIATGCLVLTAAASAFSFGGFHAYVQDVVGPQDAGKVLGITNSISILAGLAGNVVSGALLDREVRRSYQKAAVKVTGELVVSDGGASFRPIFAIAVAFHLSSWIVFEVFLKGRRLELSRLWSSEEGEKGN